MFQDHFMVVSRKFQESFKGFLEGFKEVTMFYVCFMEVSSFKSVLKVVQENFQG